MQPSIQFESVHLDEMPPVPTLIDTHTHLHFSAYAGDIDGVIHRASEAGVSKLITIGVNTDDSRKAAECAATYENVWAAVGVHPHEAGEAAQGAGYLSDLASRRKVVAIGECGLDYNKSETSKELQEQALRNQIELALEKQLPLIFHVREAFEDFFKITRDYRGLEGVVHSFSAGERELSGVLDLGLHVALNGIMTFTKDAAQLEAAKQVPLNRLLLETDSPFLTPAPNRGKTNEPSRVSDIAAFIAELRSESLEELSRQTTLNAEELFKIH